MIFLKLIDYIQFHLQFLITYPGFWQVNIFLWKFDTSSKKEMKKIKTQIFWWKTKTKQKKPKKHLQTESCIVYNEPVPLARDVTCS